MSYLNYERSKTDARIQRLYAEARTMWPKIETILDELKALGPHSLDGNNALMNIREALAQLSGR